jgi:hypothetical protein
MKMSAATVSLSAAAILVLIGLACSQNRKEQTVSLDSVPQAVREGIQKHLNGATVREIEREAEHGRTVYEVEAVRDGKRIEFEVAEDGSIVEQERQGPDDGEDDDAAGEDDDAKETRQR